MFRATGAARQDVYLPPIFEDAITLHIVKNSLELDIRTPLMMVIQGPPGEGKSIQTMEACSRLSVDLVILPGFALSGGIEKEPVHILRTAYSHATSIRKVSKRRVALLIEDLDTSIVATHPDRQYTVNSQLLTGALMYLCQDPHYFGEPYSERVPIIATGNDFTLVHDALTRHGRAVFFDWVPDPDVKKQVVRRMFSALLPPDEIEKIDGMVDHFSTPPAESIAFYEQVRDSVFDELILDQIQRTRPIDFTAVRLSLDAKKPQLTVQRFTEIGERERRAGPRKYTN